jgi:hypothetical protein
VDVADIEAASVGTIEGASAAWMMTPVGDSAESGSTITVRVLGEVRPFWSVATY